MTTSKRRKYITVAALCAVCATGLTVAALVFLDPTPVAVAHAGGAYQGNTYTNSMEALDESYKKGFRYFELDLLISQKGNIVCGYPPEKGLKIAAGTMPCTGKLLEEWLLDRRDAFIIADTKGPTTQLYEALSRMPASVKEQLIIQVYKRSDYIAAQDIGFTKLYLSFYRHPEREEENIALLREKLQYLEAVVLPHRKILTIGTKIRHLVDNRTVVYIHTINDRETRRRIKKYNYGIYTDTLTP